MRDLLWIVLCSVLSYKSVVQIAKAEMPIPYSTLGQNSDIIAIFQFPAKPGSFYTQKDFLLLAFFGASETTVCLFFFVIGRVLT